MSALTFLINLVNYKVDVYFLFLFHCRSILIYPIEEDNVIWSKMSRFVTVYLLLLIVLISLLQISQGKFNDKRIHSDSSDSMSSSAERDLKKLRYYLLTSNADERAARREQANSLRRELVTTKFISMINLFIYSLI